MKKLIFKIFPSQISKFINLKSKYRETLQHYKLITLSQLTNKPIITVFGCCRQDSVRENFIETRIKESLSYTHSTKEVLQVLDYLDAENPNPNCAFAFRTPQISGRLPNRRRLIREWKATKVVVIEISSLKFYTHKGVYFHHEAYDNKSQLSSPAINFLDVENAKGNFLSEHHMEIEALKQDLSEIISRIGNKRLVLTSNFVTRDIGSRYSIFETIKSFSIENKISFVDTRDIFNIWSIQEILIEEPVLAHLTNLGHAIMGGRYKEAILQTGNTTSNRIVFKYKSYKREEMIFGLGDYLYGVMHLVQLNQKKRNQKLILVDYSDSSIASFLTDQETIEMDDPIYFFHDGKDKKLIREKVVFTNKRPKRALSVEERDFVLRRAIPLNEETSNELNTLYSSLDLSKGRYTCIHVRIGDSEMLGTEQLSSVDFDLISSKIEGIVRNFEPKREYLVISDSMVLRKLLVVSGLNVVPGEAAHTGYAADAGSAVRQTLLEFFLLLNSEKIIQISNHSWGSGFSETASILGGVPMNRIN
jgi:hypothetical protein